MKQEKEIEVVTLMIRLYCKKQHKEARKAANVDKKGLCPECQELLEYVKFRRSKCPWGDKKPFCANCPIHCYKPEMKERIRKVMRYSGPRMIFSHPILAISHVVETLAQRKKLEKERAEKEARKQAAMEKAKAIMAERAKKAEEEAAKAEEDASKTVLDETSEVAPVETATAEVIEASGAVESNAEVAIEGDAVEAIEVVEDSATSADAEQSDIVESAKVEDTSTNIE